MAKAARGLPFLRCPCPGTCLMSLRLILWIAGAFVALALLLWGLGHVWQGMGGGITGHGWFAFILGGVFTLALSIGLFLLTFHSARHGHDDIDGPGA
ncbi:MAG: hypothetical protein B7Z22_07960 [Hyphomonas sp. 32-62-5]|nr:MAG: hypothetical protein B7Z22_07960 [Hyphomonas sp. 32-62-5]